MALIVLPYLVALTFFCLLCLPGGLMPSALHTPNCVGMLKHTPIARHGFWQKDWTAKKWGEDQEPIIPCLVVFRI
jgi:hypothetical protein